MEDTQKEIAKAVYNTIDYKDAFNHIRALADLEWNGKITITHFRDRVNEIITVIRRANDNIRCIQKVCRRKGLD